MELRQEIAGLLAAGLATEMLPRADESALVNEIVTRLRTEAGDDLTRKLVISGFVNHPVQADGFTESCQSCMYFQQHHRHCALPELELPVEPEWNCRLWRI